MRVNNNAFYSSRIQVVNCKPSVASAAVCLRYDFVVVESLATAAAPGFMFCSCFVMWFLMAFLVFAIILLRKREY